MLDTLTASIEVSLRDLVPAAEFVGARDVRVLRCSADSRTVMPGDVFVALRGIRRDGHEFVNEAVARGARAVVSERPVDVHVPRAIVPDSRDLYARICQALAGNPSRSLKAIGVTGTNGKTTTTRLIAAVLAEAGATVGTLGTLGYCDSVDREPAELTTPKAETLARWLARMTARDCSHAIMEVSSQAITERRIAGIEFAHVCLTNLGRDHLDYHHTLAAYHRAKIQLFERISAGGTAVVNVDDSGCREHLPLLPGRVITVGMQHRADLSATLVERFKSEQTFLLSAGRVSLPVRTAMIGDHHVVNCLTAAAVGVAEGVDLTTIVRGLESVRNVPGRLERIECGQSFGVFVDYAHTPEALSVALSTLREVTPGRVICVFGAGGNRDTSKRPLMGQAVESQSDLVVVTSDNPRFEDPQAIATEIFSGFEHGTRARWISDRAQAIEYALWLAEPDDTVLIAGRGHEPFQIVGEARVPLDDRDVARRYLYNLAPSSQYGALVSVGNS
jgi:UDP-N-acetylmuramoyl-L-alanyl-D-glutamate--2,6-diaminopimelate ligase